MKVTTIGTLVCIWCLIHSGLSVAWAEGADNYFDRRGGRIEERMDRKGDRIDRRLDNQGDRIEKKRASDGKK